MGEMMRLGLSVVNLERTLGTAGSEGKTNSPCGRPARPAANDGGSSAWAEVGLVGAREQAPPGWKHRLYGGQDARRYGCGSGRPV